MQRENEVQHVFLVGAKSLGAYGGYETFVYKLTEYHQNKKNIKYHVACKANGDGFMDPYKTQGAEIISDREFIYHNAECFRIHVPEKLGSAQAIYYDCMALSQTIKIIRQTRMVEGIRSLELINPLPVPLDEGISEFDAYTRSCDVDVYITFLNVEKPDVIHIHTLMGMHKEFIQAANQCKIRTVMTSHDYFGLCPKVTLYRYGKCCDDDNGCRKCIQCNLTPLSLKSILFLQSPLYRWTKDTAIVKKFRKQHRGQFFREEILPEMPNLDIEKLAEKYRKLRTYYVDMLESIDFIHFNSTVAEKIYRRHMTPKDSDVISITHQGVSSHQRIHMETEKRVILCLAPAKPFKGWDILKTACDQLWAEGKNIELRVFSPVQNPKPYMRVKEDGYSYAELGQIMEEADVLVAPSIWYETFGFTVLEALSYGVPVIVSDHVGAKDIIAQNGIVVRAGNVEDLKKAIMTTILTVNVDVKDWQTFLNENYEIYTSRRRKENETAKISN